MATAKRKASDLYLSDTCALNQEQLKVLMQATPKDSIRQRPAKGGGNWAYVKSSYVNKKLNYIFGWKWDFEVVNSWHDLDVAKQVVVLGKLTIEDDEGKKRTKMHYGRKDITFMTEKKLDPNDRNKTIKTKTNQPLDLGNDYKAATEDALKKCASKFGIASDVYDAEEFREIDVQLENENEFKKAKKEFDDENKSNNSEGNTASANSYRFKGSEL